MTLTTFSHVWLCRRADLLQCAGDGGEKEYGGAAADTWTEEIEKALATRP